jgi:radical SAM protein (TIGR01212 family)
VRPFPYRTFASYLKGRFGGLVRKVPVDGGFTCPNRDGTLGSTGCTYCDAEGGSGRDLELGPPAQQMARFIAERAGSPRREQYIAYFQSFTGTYAPVSHLRTLYQEAIAVPGVVGLSVSTRPDCLSDAVLDLLSEFSGRTWVSVELGVQTLQDPSLEAIGRGHGAADSLRAIARCRERGLFVCAHQILGLPGETEDHWQQTAATLSQAGIDAIKLHMLYVVAGTTLATLWQKGEIRLLSREEYLAGVIGVLERIRPDIVVERLLSDGPVGRTLAPDWLLDKGGLLAELQADFARLDTWQGRLA